jgi:hypothetical protein
MVSVELALPAPGVIVAGEKAQASVLGTPLQESVIMPLNPPAVTVSFPDCPTGKVIDDGDALKETVGAPAVEVHVGL